MQPVRKLTALLLAICLVIVTLPVTVSATSGVPANLRVLNVDSAVANLKVELAKGWDITAYQMPTDYDVYVINGGTSTKPYLVDMDTIRFLTTVKVVGNGYVKWKESTHGARYKQAGTQQTGGAQILGFIPVSKLDDPIYTEMALPSEGNYRYCNLSLTAADVWSVTGGNRTNGFNMVQPRGNNTIAGQTVKHLSVINMGAMYLNYSEEAIGLNDSITICIKDMKMFLHKAGTPADQWITASINNKPSANQVAHKVSIVWTEGGNINMYDRWSDAGDHVEFALTGADLRTGDADWQTNGNHQFLIHFWDSQITFASLGLDASEVDGVVCSYVAWVKEPEMANKLLATSGVDLRPGLWPETYSTWQSAMAGNNNKKPYKPSHGGEDAVGDVAWDGQSTNQIMSSRAIAVPAEPRLFFSHNVYDNTAATRYDTIVDTATVQELLGITRTLDVDKYVVGCAAAANGTWGVGSPGYNMDISGLTLPAGYDEYVINGGTAANPYKLNTESMRVLANAKVSGDGYIKWNGYNDVYKSYSTTAKAFNGVIAAADFNDPVRREMALPSDANFYFCDLDMGSQGPVRGTNNTQIWDNRKNGYNKVLPRGNNTVGGQTVAHDSAFTSGLFFLNYDVTPPARNAAITLCLKDMKLYLHKQGESSGAWHEMSVATPVTTSIRKIRVDRNVANVDLADHCTVVGDHVEIALTGADFRTADSDWQTNPAHQYFIRIFDAPSYFADEGIDASQIDGIVCTYTAWVKETAMADKVVGTVSTELCPGLWPEKYQDWQDAILGLNNKKPYKPSSGGNSAQGNDVWDGQSTNIAVTSRAVSLGGEETVVFCHSAYDSIYNTVVDSKAVQAMIGLTDGLDVDDYVADSKVETPEGWNISNVSLPTGMDKYVINGGTAAKPYLVSAETLCQLADANVEGTGYVKWIGYNARASQCGQAKSITGVVPVDKLSDPIYMEMALPSDDDFYFCDLTMNHTGPIRGGILKWNNRKNGYNGVLPRTAHTISGQTVAHDSMNNAGVIYLNYNEAPPAQNAAFTLCVKDVKVYLHKQGDAANNWRLLTDTDLPTVYKTSFSWSVNTNLASRRTVVGDHVEIALTGADLWTGQSDWKDVGSHQLYLRLWDQPAYFTSVGITDPSQIDGIVCTYTAWVKEASAADKLIATVTGELRPGLWPEVYTDWQNAIAGLNDKRPFKPSGANNSSQGDATWNGTSTNTAVASRGITLTTTPTVVFCHSVCGNAYDTVMDTATMQTLLGLN